MNGWDIPNIMTNAVDRCSHIFARVFVILTRKSQIMNAFALLLTVQGTDGKADFIRINLAYGFGMQPKVEVMTFAGGKRGEY